MKITLAILLLTAKALASDINLVWSPSPTVGVTNYTLFAHTNALTKTNLAIATVKVSVGTSTNVLVQDLAAGQWYFAATATKGGVQSDPSNIVITEVPASPENMKTVVLQYSGTLINTAGFQDVGFFRLKIQ